MIRFLLTIIIAGFCAVLQAQTTIENVSFKQVGSNIVVNYDLYCSGIFDAQLFYTTNNGASWDGPLESITGDVYGVKQGTDKSIIWNVIKDQNWLISDKIQFKVATAPNTGTFTDTRDNQTYMWVKIGKQKWMAENLNFNTGDSWCYDIKSSKCSKYGRLYTWETAKSACPDGWHLPTDNEWKQLEKQVGMSQTDANSIVWRGTNEGEKLKSISDWKDNGNGTDVYGFNAIPGGKRGSNNSFGYIGEDAYFWSATEYDLSNAWYRSLYYGNLLVRRSYSSKTYGRSVRCIKDN